MAKTREEKEQLVDYVRENLQKAKIVVFVGVKGLKVDQTDELRKTLKDNESYLKVIKTSLIKIGLKNANIEIDADQMNIPVAVVFGNFDEISAPKTLNLFSKTNENLQILGGIYQNSWIDAEQVKKLANIQPRLDLETKLVGSIAAPISRFNNALAGNLRSLVYIFSQYQQTK